SMAAAIRSSGCSATSSKCRPMSFATDTRSFAQSSNLFRRVKRGVKRRSHCSTTTAGLRGLVSTGRGCGATRSRRGPTNSRAGENTELELVEGRAIVAAMAYEAGPGDAASIRNILRSFDGGNAGRRAELMLSDELRDLSARCPQRTDAVRYPRDLEIVVDRKA